MLVSSLSLLGRQERPEYIQHEVPAGEAQAQLSLVLTTLRGWQEDGNLPEQRSDPFDSLLIELGCAISFVGFVWLV